jgi:hypothetical protein
MTIISEFQNFQIQKYNYKIPEYIPFNYNPFKYNPFKYNPFKYNPFKYNPFKKHPPKLGVSYYVMLGCWFGGMRMGLRRAWGGCVSLCVVCRRRDRIWCGGLLGGGGYGVATACILRLFVARLGLVQ